jgi:hypothetical protein
LKAVAIQHMGAKVRYPAAGAVPDCARGMDWVDSMKRTGLSWHKAPPICVFVDAGAVLERRARPSWTVDFGLVRAAQGRQPTGEMPTVC